MQKIKQNMNNVLSSDLVVRPEFIGLPQLLSPFLQHSSSQRSMMSSSHQAQALVIEGSESPRIMTGYEKQVGEEEFTKCRVDQDIVIRKRIPKFNPSVFRDKMTGTTPSWTVIYTGEDGMVHCMDVPTYTYLHDGFGYFNKMLGIENNLLYPGNVVQKGTKLTTSPSHDGNRWKMGTNANVAYLGEWSTTEDACTISRSLAEKGANLAILQTKLTIGIDDIPLDLYGDGDTYQCFPNIGEHVRDDGVLICLRPNNESTFVSDMSPSRLREIELIHDEPHRAPPGATVIDVDVYINRDQMRKMKDRDDSIYKQFLDFHKAQEYYYNAVLDAYTELCTKDGEDLPMSPEFNTLVVKCACLSNNKKFISGKNIKLYDARDPVEFITIVITYAYRRKITIGSKLTDKYGGKGVVAAIWEDENMPTDDRGVRADIIMTPPSIINRMNPSQMLEQFWNCTAFEVMRRIREKMKIPYDEEREEWFSHPSFQKHWRWAYDYILGFFNDFRPAYAQFIEQIHPSDKLKMSLVEASLQEGLYLINAFRTPNTPEELIKVAEKYGVNPTPVTYRVQNKDTGEWKTVRTQTEVMIGNKYLMLLGKIPASAISAVAVGHVSQHETPIKPKSKHIKSQNVIGLTPQKFGEDETCILNMSIGPAAIARLYGVYATSPECVKQLAEMLLKEPSPSAIPCIPVSTQEVVDRSANISLLMHFMAVIGYDVASCGGAKK